MIDKISYKYICTLFYENDLFYAKLDPSNVIGYTHLMIKEFKHKGLEKFFLRGTKAGIQAKHANRLRVVLGRLHASNVPKDMDLPGLKLHELTGNRKGIWSVKVDGNWRVTFEFRGEDAYIVDYEDYH